MYKIIDRKFIGRFGGAQLLSFGYALSVPFLLSKIAGVNADPEPPFLWGAICWVAGAGLLIWSLYKGKIIEWMKFLGIAVLLEVCTAILTGLIAKWAFEMTGGELEKAERIAELFAAAAGILVHSWQAGSLGILIRHGKFCLIYSWKFWCTSFAVCIILGALQRWMFYLPQSGGWIIVNGAAGGFLVWSLIEMLLFFSGKWSAESGKAE